MLFSAVAKCADSHKVCTSDSVTDAKRPPRTRRTIAVTCALGLSIFAQSARANPELISTYDARAAGLAGTGVSYQTNGAAPVHNVALLSGINRLSVSATFTPYVLQLDSPFGGLGSAPEQIKSKWSLGPLAQLGVGVRVHKKIVVGIAAFLPLGLASTYNNAPLSSLVEYAGKLKVTGQVAPIAFTRGDIKPMLLMGELVIPVSVEVLDWLAVGAAYRMTYANQSLSTTVGGAEVLNLAMSAKHFAGFDLGVFMRPSKKVHVGLSYRSQVDADYETDLTLSLPNQKKTTSHLVNPLGAYSAPHLAKAGVAVRPMGDKLMLTGEYRYYFYQAANNAQSLQQLEDAWTAGVGIEVRPVGTLALRAGGAFGTLATPRAGATPFAPPPGTAWIATVGAGVKVPFVDIDLAVGYGQEGSGKTDAPPATPGNYHDSAVMGSLSANFHL